MVDPTCDHDGPTAQRLDARRVAQIVYPKPFLFSFVVLNLPQSGARAFILQVSIAVEANRR